MIENPGDDWLDSLEGASTHFFTNRVRLGLSADETARLILPGFPFRRAPALIHEAIHHWFFQSELGGALAICKLVAYERAKHGDIASAADFVSLYGCVLSLYRPLLEGAALFGEFDGFHAPTPRSPIPPYGVLPLLFGDDPVVSGNLHQSVGSLVSLLMAELRRHTAFVDAKCDLYATRGVTATNYLLGYHCMKQRWLEFHLEDDGDHFLDGQLFLDLVRLYFFNDFSVVDLIYDQQSPLGAKVERLAEYLRQRMDAFPALARNAALVRRLHWVRESPGNALTIRELQAFGVFPDSADRGVERTAEAMFEVLGGRPLLPDDLPALKILNNREAFCVAAQNVSFVGKDRRLEVVSSRGEPLFRLEMSGDVHGARGEGHFSSHLFMDGAVLVNTIMQGRTLVWRQTCGNPADADRHLKRLHRIETSQDVVDTVLAGLEQHLKRHRLSDSATRDLLARCEERKQIIYGFCGCAPDPRGQARDWIRKLVDEGFDAMLADPDLVRCLAVIGIENSRLTHDYGEICETLRHHDIRGETAIAALQSFAAMVPEPLRPTAWSLVLRYGTSVLARL